MRFGLKCIQCAIFCLEMPFCLQCCWIICWTFLHGAFWYRNSSLLPGIVFNKKSLMKCKLTSVNLNDHKRVTTFVTCKLWGSRFHSRLNFTKNENILSVLLFNLCSQSSHLQFMYPVLFELLNYALFVDKTDLIFLL